MAKTCDDTNTDLNPNTPEICDDIDNDCDGLIDDGVGQNFYPDIDEDGFGDASNPEFGCVVPEGFEQW